MQWETGTAQILHGIGEIYPAPPSYPGRVVFNPGVFRIVPGPVRFRRSALRPDVAEAVVSALPPQPWWN